MHQTMHIFKKDVQYLYREAALVLVLAVIFAGVETRDPGGMDVSMVLELLIALTVAFTIARVIHAEPIPGDTQFWITRPYRWRALLSAKLLFVLTFVNLPVLLAQVFVLGVHRFSIGSNLAGLVGFQLLLIFALEVPVAVIAALTRGIVGFTASVLVLALIAVGLQMQADRSHEPFEWLRYAAVFLAVALIAPLLLYLQYKSRRTLVNRLWALGAVSLAVAAFLVIPWPALFALQSRLSKRSFNLQVTPDTSTRIDLTSRAGKELYVVLPVRISAFPDGYRPQFEDFVITLRGPDGGTMRLSEGQLFTDYQTGDSLGIRGRALLDPSFFQAERDQPLKATVTFYVTVFGNSHGASFSVPDTPKEILDGLQCFENSINDLVCGAAFRLPPKSISIKTNGLHPLDKSLTVSTHTVSYSPFPATLRLNPIRMSEPYYLPPGESAATITIEEPLAYLRSSFEIPEVHIVER
jgi:hypothetical protein